MTQQIYAPVVGESVTIGQHTKTFAISLADSLMTTLKLARVSLFSIRVSHWLTSLHQFEDSEMAFVSGKIVTHTSSLPVLEPLSSVPGPTLVSADSDVDTTRAAKINAVDLPRSTMIGDLKLTALRARLTALGISAEFAGEGLLVCSGGGVGDMEQTVAVRKTGRGKISVEGYTGDVYFTVRKEIYGLHAVVAQP